MPDHDRLDADLIAEMMRSHFQKLARLSIQTAGHAEMGRIYARAVARSSSEELEKTAILNRLRAAGKFLTKKRTIKLPGAKPSTSAVAPTRAVSPTPAVQATPTVPPAAKPKKKGMGLKTKMMLGTAAAGVPTVYLGGKALDTTKAFLTPQAPGSAYVYGQGAPAYQNRSWGM